jgi:hypothetical protein
VRAHPRELRPQLPGRLGDRALLADDFLQLCAAARRRNQRVEASLEPSAPSVSAERADVSLGEQVLDLHREPGVGLRGRCTGAQRVDPLLQFAEVSMSGNHSTGSRSSQSVARSIAVHSAER